MNSVLLDIAEYLDKHNFVSPLSSYEVRGVKTYYDAEMILRIAIKVYIKDEDKVEVILLGADNLEYLEHDRQSVEQWFEELN